jgi:hypothetical protein
MVSHFDQVLRSYVDKDQKPGYAELVHRSPPAATDSVCHMIEQVHVDEQKDMIPFSVSAVEINIKCAEIPDLNDGK